MATSSRDFTHPALVLIDLQNGFFESPGLAEKRAEITANCNRLVRAARDASVPVFNVRTEHKKDGSTWTIKMLEDDQGYLFEGTEQAANLAELDAAGSIEIIKRRDSAFWNTELLTGLLRHRVTSLVLAGVSSPTCVASTAADAFAANLAVAVAHDAVTSEDEDFERNTLKFMREQHRQLVESTAQLVRRITAATP